MPPQPRQQPPRAATILGDSPAPRLATDRRDGCERNRISSKNWATTIDARIRNHLVAADGSWLPSGN